MDEYEINKKTMAVISIGDKKSKIIEEDNEYIVNKSAFEVMDNSCKFFGSSYTGRVEGTKYLVGYSYKPPIIVEETNKIIFFPTESPRLSSCSWLSLYHYKDTYNEDNSTKVVFKNGRSIDVGTSCEVIENQLLRSSRLESELDYRKKD